jgi:hypothetical protein
VLQPGQEQASGQVVERAGRARDDQPPAAEVDVAEMQLPDGLGPGGVDGGQGDREAGGRRDRGGGGLVYLGGQQRLDEDQGTLAVVDAAGGVAEDRAGLLGVAEQRAQGGQGLPAQAAVQRLGGGDDVISGDLAQMRVVPGPFQPGRRPCLLALRANPAQWPPAEGAARRRGARPPQDRLRRLLRLPHASEARRWLRTWLRETRYR